MDGNFSHNILFYVILTTFYRLFYQILNDAVDLSKFNLQNPTRKGDMAIFSLAFNVLPRSSDGRPREVRLESPRLWDIAWIEIAVPFFEPATRTSHFLLDTARLVQPVSF
jgi:hypothetical protein